MINEVFWKIMENVRKLKHIKLVTTETKRNYLESKAIYHTTNIFFWNFIAIAMKIIGELINEPVYLGLSTLEISKIVMYGFWYDYLLLKYGEKGQLCYMGTDRFTVYIKTEEIYSGIVKNIERRCGTSNHCLDKPWLKIKNRGVIGLIESCIR